MLRITTIFHDGGCVAFFSSIRAVLLACEGVDLVRIREAGITWQTAASLMLGKGKTDTVGQSTSSFWIQIKFIISTIYSLLTWNANWIFRSKVTSVGVCTDANLILFNGYKKLNLFCILTPHSPPGGILPSFWQKLFSSTGSPNGYGRHAVSAQQGSPTWMLNKAK